MSESGSTRSSSSSSPTVAGADAKASANDADNQLAATGAHGIAGAATTERRSPLESARGPPIVLFGSAQPFSDAASCVIRASDNAARRRLRHRPRTRAPNTPLYPARTPRKHAPGIG